jgi:prepilin signal peptidase PulO-like enzyme (type II secretory pathway)
VELLGGVIFTTVPLFLHTHFNAPYFVISIWVFVFLTLLLMSVIDLRLQIIPDGLTAFLSVLALVLVGYFYFFIPSGEPFGRHAVTGTFLGSYGLVFGFALDPFIRAAIGASFGLLFLGGLYVGTKGRGIGFGDVKLAGALGLLLGWPDILPTLLSAFILGSLVSVPLMVFRGKGMKTAVPFGPFIALGVAVIFFFGYDIVNAYFTLFGIM